MAKLKDVKNQGNNGRWDLSFKDDLFQIPNKSTPVRLWEEIREIRQHWVEFVSQTKGKTGYGEMCLNWDPVSEKTIEGNCPLCEAGKKPTVYYYGFMINRRARSLVVQPVRLTQKLASKIGKLSEIAYPDLGEDAPDATDQKRGFDVMISQSNTNGKVEYEAHAGEKKPVTKEEREAFEEYVAEHDIGKLAKAAVQPRAALLDGLARRGVEGFAAAKANSAAKKRNYEDYDSAPDDDEDPVAPAKKSSAAAKPAKRASLTGDEDEDDVPARKPARKTALDEDDEEEATPSRRYATADEDDAPDDEE